MHPSSKPLMLSVVLLSAALISTSILAQVAKKPDNSPKRAINCNISERVKNKNRSTSCIYKCPDGGTENASVDEGFSCPSVVNVLRR